MRKRNLFCQAVNKHLKTNEGTTLKQQDTSCVSTSKFFSTFFQSQEFATDPNVCDMALVEPTAQGCMR